MKTSAANRMPAARSYFFQHTYHKMNIYRYRFASACPSNGGMIIFDVEIRSEKMVMVEHIVTACALHKKAYHETIADDLFHRFGGYQVIKAHHHGVDIESIRGSN